MIRSSVSVDFNSEEMNVLFRNKPRGSVHVHKCLKASLRVTFGTINLLKRPKENPASLASMGQKKESYANHQREKQTMLKHALV